MKKGDEYAPAHSLRGRPRSHRGWLRDRLRGLVARSEQAVQEHYDVDHAHHVDGSDDYEHANHDDDEHGYHAYHDDHDDHYDGPRHPNNDREPNQPRRPALR